MSAKMKRAILKAQAEIRKLEAKILPLQREINRLEEVINEEQRQCHHLNKETTPSHADWCGDYNRYYCPDCDEKWDNARD